MSIDDNKSVVHDFIEPWTNEGHEWESDDWNACPKVVKPDVAIHSAIGETERSWVRHRARGLT